MSAINLQELCRVCLKSLRNTRTVTKISAECVASMDCEMSYNLIPNLCQLFLYITTMDVAQETEKFPKLLCQLCFKKLMDYDDFRKLTLSNTKRLYDMLKEEDVVVKTEKTSGDEEDVRVKVEYNEENEDDKLLLPELANFPIKTEQYFEASDTQFVSTPLIADEGENKGQHSYNCSDEDDADDEELFLSNGAANTSSPSMYTAEGKPAKYMVLTKRDRNQKRSLHCSTCNKQFYKQIYLDAHVRGIHMGEAKPFQCVVCPKSFTRYNQLYIHKRSQHIAADKDPIECNANASNSIQLDKIVHDDIPNIKEVIPRNAELESGEYTCEICLRNYSSRRALMEHLKRHKQIKEHVCIECGAAKVTRTELQTHMRVHIPNLEKFQCPQCPQVFNHKNAISRHVKVVHEGQKRFPCSYCTKRFSTRNSKTCHERLHTGERPFSCDLCHKAFVQQESLRSHMKNHDKTLRKHVCSYCSQRFITLKNLVDHEKRHLGDKPHICNICSKGFYKEEDLQIHRSSHELMMDENQDECSDSEQTTEHIKFENGLDTSCDDVYNKEDENQGAFSEMELPTDSGTQSSN